MADVAVGCTAQSDGWACRVVVTEGSSRTEHSVIVARADLARFAPADNEPNDLVRRSFEFLLAREPKETILRRFALTDIARYFPEWETEMSERSTRA